MLVLSVQDVQQAPLTIKHLLPQRPKESIESKEKILILPCSPSHNPLGQPAFATVNDSNILPRQNKLVAPFEFLSGLRRVYENGLTLLVMSAGLGLPAKFPGGADLPGGNTAPVNKMSYPVPTMHL